MLTGLSSYCELNQGGLMQLSYAPLHWLGANDTLISDAGVWLSAITFSTGDWLTLPLLPRDNAWQENRRANDQGVYYDQEISGIVPGLRAAASAEIEEMEHMRFLVKLQDRNARTWLIGSLEEGLDFSAQATTGPIGGLNAYTIRFSGLQLWRAASYAH